MILFQTIKFIKSTLQLRHSLEFNKLRDDVTARSGTVQYNELPACAAFGTGAFCDHADAPNRKIMCLRSDALYYVGTLHENKRQASKRSLREYID